jgi:hypothetical protein
MLSIAHSMLHIQCMSIASMAKQFLSNIGTRDVLLILTLPQKNITKSCKSQAI